MPMFKVPTIQDTPYKETLWDRRARPTSSFWDLHGTGLFFCLVAEVISVLALFTLGPLFLKMGLEAVFYLGLIGFAMAASVALPVRWAVQHRQFRRVLDA